MPITSGGSTPSASSWSLPATISWSSGTLRASRRALDISLGPLPKRLTTDRAWFLFAAYQSELERLARLAGLERAATGRVMLVSTAQASAAQVREELAAKEEDKRRNLARVELAWLRRGAPARTSKPKARIESATRIVEGRPQSAKPSCCKRLESLLSSAIF